MSIRNARQFLAFAAAAGLSLAMMPTQGFTWKVTDCMRISRQKPSTVPAFPGGISVSNAGPDDIEVLVKYQGVPGAVSVMVVGVTTPGSTFVPFPLVPPAGAVKVKSVVLKDAICPNGLGSQGNLFW